ncbi:GumC family protein [Qipengyuania aquimaris]|uniref:Lipopolysaccharide biosynthesis protein n=1 Tax=Qipengyuania aquimaris TaxID=255984 RepID=A0A9Q3S1J2_9SPHN|nr:Wzz/FepE/Etk N-terminal domain-containing protein [Qipengyuania aquimaris]MBY6218115.1 lipopolysaccharide biosynthesis protein [Qipengyuania aquimaris]
MSNEFEDEYSENSSQLGNLIPYLPTIIRERWLLLVCPAILFLGAGIAAAFTLPEVYRSSATLLVETPRLSNDVLGAETELVDRRVETFRRQILSRPRLIELVQKHRLYPDMGEDAGLSANVDELREAISIEAVSSRTGFGRPSTVAFELSFDYSEPSSAQAVMQDITEQILFLDVTQSAEQANNTVQFLTEQASAIESQIDEVAAEIRSITATNGLALSNPGMLALGDSSGSSEVQIIALQRDNALLRAQRAAQQSSAQRDPIVSAAEAELAAARARYTENHPDIALARRRLEEARQLAASNQARLPDDTIDQQIAANNAQIDALRSIRAQDVSRQARAQNAMARSPLVQEQIAQKQQRLNQYNEQYEAVTERLRQAQASARAESERKGERLSIIEPPSLPLGPISPNRTSLIGAGLVGGIGLGLLLVLFLELFKRPIRDPGDILEITGSTSLGSIPTVEGGANDGSKSWQSRLSFGRFASHEQVV